MARSNAPELKKPFSVILYGSGGAGKTALFEKLVNPGSQFLEPHSTRGIVYKNTKDSALQFVDTGGSELNAPYTKGLIPSLKADISVICVQANDMLSLSEAKKEYAPIINAKNNNAPIIIVITQTDQILKETEEFKNGMKAFKDQLGIKEEPYRTSALSGTGIKELRQKISTLKEQLVDYKESSDAFVNAKQKISSFHDMVKEAALELRTISGDSYEQDPNYQAVSKIDTQLKTVLTAHDGPSSMSKKDDLIHAYKTAAQEFTKHAQSVDLKVESPKVRGILDRIWDAIVNLNYKLLFDSADEVKDKQRFAQQKMVKEDLIAIKKENSEPNNTVDNNDEAKDRPGLS